MGMKLVGMVSHNALDRGIQGGGRKGIFFIKSLLKIEFKRR